MQTHGYLRHLPIAGTHNLRDLGGYSTVDGKITRWHTFLRGDALHRLSPTGQQQLLDLGVRTIIDLRFPYEVESEPNVFAGKSSVNYHHISLMSGLSAARPTPSAIARQASLEVIYRGILDHCQLTVRTIFEVINQEKEGTVLFHCTAGKDRTGLIAALLLGIANVETETIAKDYALTDQYLGALKDELRKKAAAAGQDMTEYEHMLESKPEAMRNTIGYINQQYGGVAAYLQHIGLYKSQLNTLYSRITE